MTHFRCRNVWDTLQHSDSLNDRNESLSQELNYLSAQLLRNRTQELWKMQTWRHFSLHLLQWHLYIGRLRLYRITGAGCSLSSFLTVVKFCFFFLTNSNLFIYYSHWIEKLMNFCRLDHFDSRWLLYSALNI